MNNLREQIVNLQKKNAILAEQLQNSKAIAYSAIKDLIEAQKNRRKDDSRGALRIMATDTTLDADIIDEGLYLAGNKIYKWGDTMRLDQ